MKERPQIDILLVRSVKTVQKLLKILFARENHQRILNFTDTGKMDMNVTYIKVASHCTSLAERMEAMDELFYEYS